MPETVQCPVCQKSYAMKPEFAGKRVKCKCGEKFTFPAANAPEASPPLVKATPKKTPVVEEVDGGEYDIAGEKKAAPVGHVPEGQCRGCRKPLTPGSIICTACGYNQKTGSVMRTQVL